MKVAKIINNNVVSTCDEEDREIIIMGKGVGLRAKEGNTIDEEKIEKIFHLESRNTMDKFKGLPENLPMEHVQISTEIIGHTKEVLSRPVNPNVYTTLTDHINFALERYKQKMVFSNPLTREVRSFYHAEYLTGGYVMAMIERDLGAKPLVNGAASITLHIVDVEYDAPTGDTIKITNLMQQVLEVIREYLSIELDKQFLSYERLITHLRFLAQRVFTREHMNLGSLGFQEVTDRLYPEEYACSQKIQALIRLQYRHQVMEGGVTYLALYIKRIRTK